MVSRCAANDAQAGRATGSAEHESILSLILHSFRDAQKTFYGSAPALTDVLGGRVPIMFDLWSSVKPYVVEGRLKVLAVVGAQRLSEAPEYPTLAETFPGFAVDAFQSIIVPKAVPQAVLDKLSGDIRTVVSSQEFADKVRPLGVFPQATTPQELDALFRKEVERWSAIVKTANIQID